MSLIWNKSYFPTNMERGKSCRTTLETPSLQLSGGVYHETCAKNEPLN